MRPTGQGGPSDRRCGGMVGRSPWRHSFAAPRSISADDDNARYAEEVSRMPRTGTGAALTAVILLASVSGVMPQRGEVHLTVDAPASLAPAADRVRRVDRQSLAEALARAGLTFPPQIHVTLIAEDDLRARATPEWIVGLASGRHDIAIFPERIGSYPYESLE